MPKTYVPQLIRNVRHLRDYVNKHKPKMAPQLNAAQLAALDSIKAAADAFDGVVVQEQP